MTYNNIIPGQRISYINKVNRKIIIEILSKTAKYVVFKEIISDYTDVWPVDKIIEILNSEGTKILECPSIR